MLNQGTKYWAISDAIALAVKFIERYKLIDKICLGAGNMELDNLEQHLVE